MRTGQLVKRELVKPRTRFHHGQLREAVVVATTAIVERDGHQAVSLRAVAHALGVTEPAIYRHFANKEAILAEVSAGGMRRFMVTIATEISAHADPFDAIEHTGRAYVRFSVANPGWFRLTFSRIGTEQLQKHHVVQAAMVEAGAAYMGKMYATLGTFVAKDNVPDAYRAFWALAHGLSTFVVERVFQLVQTDEQRMEAAYAAIGVFVDAYRSSRRAA
ncbi:MAG TPA: TetR/AcrR family transcriptional regulator [Kofleriaceae bacterium]|jgi:AcrR family transcriptional regulator|nr:TetR/AcrR family transcriptional regulator [Kofleriaceae bacterium]